MTYTAKIIKGGKIVMVPETFESFGLLKMEPPTTIDKVAAAVEARAAGAPCGGLLDVYTAGFEAESLLLVSNGGVTGWEWMRSQLRVCWGGRHQEVFSADLCISLSHICPSPCLPLAVQGPPLRSSPGVGRPPLPRGPRPQAAAQG